MEPEDQTSNVHKQPNSDKENRINITAVTPSLPANTNQLTDQLTIRQQQQQQSFTKPSTKTGLHESLKSLSAQVRMMEEDKDELAIDQTNGFKRKSKSNEDGNIQKYVTPVVGSSSTPVLTESPPPPPTISNVSSSITINNLKNSNSSPKVTGSTDQIFNSVLGSPSSQSSDSRR